MQHKGGIPGEYAAASFERPIDLVHLARQTLGDRSLEREVLNLFVVQARSILTQMELTPPGKPRLELAHTLKGSARSVGAWHVATEAEACEALFEATEASWRGAIERLGQAIRTAIVAIEDVQQAA
jgi:HPt (histidine-containing phosphotransfer) domain-containing protein